MRLTGVDAEALGMHVTGEGSLLAGNELTGRVVGPYLLGRLLPMNPWLAVRLFGWGLEHAAGGPVELAPLDDALEESAHRAATTRAAGGR